MRGFDWTAEAIARLRTLWAEGHSGAEIGRRMGLTKCAVVGKAHRLDLPARPSPIRAMAEGAARKPPRSRLDGPRQRPPRIGLAALEHARAVSAAASAARPVAAAPATAPVERPRPFAQRRTCQWIEGEARGGDSRFCAADAAPGSSYCPSHHARCWHPSPRRSGLLERLG
jgi:GcrA cell cycle regulator